MSFCTHEKYVLRNNIIMFSYNNDTKKHQASYNGRL